MFELLKFNCIAIVTLLTLLVSKMNESVINYKRVTDETLLAEVSQYGTDNLILQLFSDLYVFIALKFFTYQFLYYLLMSPKLLNERQTVYTLTKRCVLHYLFMSVCPNI